MAIISVTEYGCHACVQSTDEAVRERLREVLYPDNKATIELSYDPECNNLDIEIRDTYGEGDGTPYILASIPPDIMIVKLLSMFVAINDVPFQELEKED